MVWVFAARQKDAAAWARRAGLPTKEVQVFGNLNRHREGVVFRRGDRVVILGEVSGDLQQFIDRTAGKSLDGYTIDRIPLEPA